MIVDKNFKEVRGGFSRKDRAEYGKKMAAINMSLFVKDTKAVSVASAAFNETVRKQLEAVGLRKAGA